MNNLLNEYFRLNFELNIELNHFLARFNVKMNNQNVSATPTLNCSNHLRLSLQPSFDFFPKMTVRVKWANIYHVRIALNSS